MTKFDDTISCWIMNWEQYKMGTFKKHRDYYCTTCGQLMIAPEPYGVGMFSDVDGLEFFEIMYTCPNRKWYHVGFNSHRSFSIPCERIKYND